MSVQQPAWRKRSRPCPFFSQGRCLFADSCNFLHDVKVRSPLDLPLAGASETRQPTFDPPCVVVDSASPRSANLACLGSVPSPVQDSSRYSGLLSVLSDVIGPPSSLPTVAEDAGLYTFGSTSHGRTDSIPDSDVVSLSFESAGTAHAETEHGSGCVEPCSMLPLDYELVERPECQTASLFREEDGEPVSEYFPVSDDVASSVADGSSYFVEDTGRDHADEDFTVTVSNRHSTLSSFTGVSLLASPRHSVVGDLLSPVELSAKLRPFSVAPLGSKVRRGDSIDSGYADGDDWIGPRPFPRSPPRSRHSQHPCPARDVVEDIAEVDSEPGSGNVEGSLDEPSLDASFSTALYPSHDSDAVDEPLSDAALRVDRDTQDHFHFKSPEMASSGPSFRANDDHAESSQPDPSAVLSQRSRAASDLTVKATSPPTDCAGSPSHEQLHRSGSVQSLYDHYLDSCGSPGPSSPAHKVSDLSGQASQLLDLAPDRESSDARFGNPSADSPRSESVLSPLSTGQRLPLHPFHPEPVPKVNLDGVDQVHHPHPSTHLQTKEIGSTMVPLGFRRQKPLPAALAQPSRSVSLPSHAALPASQLREVLRIRTDLPQSHLPSRCSSAGHVSSTTHSPLHAQSMSAPPTGGLKPLRLSSVIHKRSSILSTRSSSIASSTLSLDHLFTASAPHSPSVSSTTSFSRNSSLSSSCEHIPEQVHHTPKRPRASSPTPQVADDAHLTPQSSSTRRNSRSVSASIQQPKPWRLSNYRAGSRNDALVDTSRRFSRRASTLSFSYALDEEQETDGDDPIISHPTQLDHPDNLLHPAAVLAPPVHAIATPKPTLLFAIASDDVNQVRQVLESGEAGPNDPVGPQSALAFTLTNDKLAHKAEIVKALLAYGANPSALQNPTLNPSSRAAGVDEPSAPPPETTLEGMDPATRYFVARADAAHTRQTSQLIYRSFFRPLTRVRYDVIGQDWALEQLFRVLSMHSQKLAVAPIVVLLCGPSGHGKSLLARKFGYLLDVPTHTVNMTTVQSAHDIWQSFSMSPYEEPSSCTLAEFLIENEGKRCVVVLDEIEKVEDQKALWSLLMPWELGRCSLEAGKRHVDARNVIWLATSNIGHELVFEYHENRAEPDTRMLRENYLELMSILRPRVSHCLGASLVSRVTTVLPFVPFTLEEKKAIAAEAVYAFSGDASKTLSPQEVESLIIKALPSYRASEGARSLHRVISNILIDAIP